MIRLILIGLLGWLYVMAPAEWMTVVRKELNTYQETQAEQNAREWIKSHPEITQTNQP